MMRCVSIVLGIVNKRKIFKNTYTAKTLKLYCNLSTNTYLKIANYKQNFMTMPPPPRTLSLAFGLLLYKYAAHTYTKYPLYHDHKHSSCHGMQAFYTI